MRFDRPSKRTSRTIKLDLECLGERIAPHGGQLFHLVSPVVEFGLVNQHTTQLAVKAPLETIGSHTPIIAGNTFTWKP